MSKKMQSVLEHFANNDIEKAKKLLRQVFVENAQKINKELEEEFEKDVEDKDVVEEDIDTNPETSLTDEVGYKLDEDFGEWDDEDKKDDKEEVEEGLMAPDMSGGDMGQMHEADDEAEMDAMPIDGGEDEIETDSAPMPDEDQWNAIKSTIDELTEIFDSLSSGDDEGLDMEDDSVEGHDDFGSDDFGDVPMGDKKFGESYKMKPVTEPTKTETEATNKKSPIAPNAKSPVEGVKPIKINNGTVVLSDDKSKNADALDAKVDDNNNILPSGKAAMKNATVPKNTAEKSTSPVPKQKAR